LFSKFPINQDINEFILRTSCVLTEEEFEDLLYIIRKKPVKSRGVYPEEKFRREQAIIYLLTHAFVYMSYPM
ncbi:hypothetical protein V7149_13925, partial [Bacillus sp. JJ1503]